MLGAFYVPGLAKRAQQRFADRVGEHPSKFKNSKIFGWSADAARKNSKIQKFTNSNIFEFLIFEFSKFLEF